MTILAKAIAAHRGQRTLAETYWCWLIVPQAAIAILILLVSFNSIRLVTFNPALYYGPVFFFEILLLAVLFYFGLGVLRSARRAQSRFWATVASILVILAFVSTPVQLLLDWFNIATPGEDDIGQQLNILNAQLPRRIDDITTIERIEYSDHVLYYRYTVALESVNQLSIDALRQNIIKSACGTWKKDLTNGTFRSIDYQYQGTSGPPSTISLTAADCR